jgi:hypothetical protein
MCRRFEPAPDHFKQTKQPASSERAFFVANDNSFAETVENSCPRPLQLAKLVYYRAEIKPNPFILTIRVKFFLRGRKTLSLFKHRFSYISGVTF